MVIVELREHLSLHAPGRLAPRLLLGGLGQRETDLRRRSMMRRLEAERSRMTWGRFGVTARLRHLGGACFPASPLAT